MTFPAQLLSFFTSRQGPSTAYSVPGIYSEVVPAGVSVVSAVCIGGGGGGAGGSSSNASGSGGGGGGGLTWGIFPVTPGETLTIQVGAGGPAGANNGSGGTGGFSRLRRNVTGTTAALADVNILEAGGGSGGTRLVNGSGGAGGFGNPAVVYTDLTNLADSASYTLGSAAQVVDPTSITGLVALTGVNSPSGRTRIITLGRGGTGTVANRTITFTNTYNLTGLTNLLYKVNKGADDPVVIGWEIPEGTDNIELDASLDGATWTTLSSTNPVPLALNTWVEISTSIPVQFQTSGVFLRIKQLNSASINLDNWAASNIYYASPNFTPYVLGGGTGGAGGSANGGADGAGGGGGAGGYRGNGGTGGGINPITAPTAATLNSGGGGGGGATDGSGSATGYGGGGVGAFGYVGIGQGAAGTNDTGGGGTGGDGGSFFNDPGVSGINPGIVTDFVSTGSTIGITTNIPVLQDDFLLLLSGSDKDSGILELSVPTGFTTFSKSINGVYSVATGSAATAVIPSNVTTNPTRDINFASSYKYVTEDDVDSRGFYVGNSGTNNALVGLASTAIHNLIALRYIPNPATIQYSTSSGDPAINVGVGGAIASPMPDPPAVTGITTGALTIALGFLSNTLISPDASNIAGDNSTTIGSINGGVPPDGTANMAVYLTAGGGPSGSIVNPAQMKTGTASHARAFTIEIRRANAGTGIVTVGYAATGSYEEPIVGGGTTVIQPATTLNLPSSTQPGDLIIYVGTSDSRRGKTDTSTKGGKTLNEPNFGGGNDFTTLQFAGQGQGVLSNDTRGGGSLSFRIAYRTFQSGDPLTVGNLTTEADPILSQTAAIAHSFIVLRNTVQYGSGGNPSISNFTVWDNGDPNEYPSGWTGAYGPPDPPALTTTQANSFILGIGMLDNVTISNVTTITPPDNYTKLQNRSYGEQNNGAIIMSSIRTGLAASISEDPTEYVGAGANIWVSQTILIGGSTGEISGTNLGAGKYGGGGGARLNTQSGTGVPGASGAVRLIYGTGRQYPSGNQGNVTATW